MNRVLAVLLAVVLVCGCASEKAGDAFSQDKRLQPTTAPTSTMKANSFAVLETSKGKIKFALFEDKAPISTKNFIGLAERGFYTNMVFHRVVPGFVIQTGDPTGTGTGGSNKTIPLEIHPGLKHNLGAVGMARSSDPNSASSQFYITLADVHDLDGNYAVFGQVVEGMDVVKKIKQVDKLLNVTIVES